MVVWLEAWKWVPKAARSAFVDQTRRVDAVFASSAVSAAYSEGICSPTDLNRLD